MMMVKGQGDDDEPNPDQPGGDDGQTGDSGDANHRRVDLAQVCEGATEGELLEDCPHLAPKDIRVARAYGAASVAHEEVVLLSGVS